MKMNRSYLADNTCSPQNIADAIIVARGNRIRDQIITQSHQKHILDFIIHSIIFLGTYHIHITSTMIIGIEVDSAFVALKP